MSLDKWLTLDELAAYLKISRTKLYQLSQDAQIPASKIGNQWRFNQEEIDAWMKNQRPNNTTSQQRKDASSETSAEE